MSSSVVRQSGNITRGHIPTWVTDGVINDSQVKLSTDTTFVNADYLLGFTTRTLAAAATIGTDITMLVTSGYTSSGDGGDALYVHANGSTLGGFQSVDGQWWQLAPPYTIDAFGAKGDGSTDDTTAVTNAFTKAKSDGVPLFGGGTGKTYKITSGPSTSFTGVYFDGRNCTFKLTGTSATYFDFESASNAFTSLNASTVIGDASIVVTSAANFTIGDVMVIAVTRADGSFNGFTTVIVNIAGTTITMQDRIPPGLTINSATETNSVTTYTLGRGYFRNAVFDGSSFAGTALAPLTISTLGGEVSGLVFLNCYGDDINGGGMVLNNSCLATVKDIYCRACGGSLANAFLSRQCSNCTFNDIRAHLSHGFSTQWFSGSLNTINNVQSHAAGQTTNARGILIQGECSSCFDNLVVVNARFTQLALTRHAQSNVINNVLAIGRGNQAANTQAVWTSDNNCSNNLFNNIVAVGDSASNALVQFFTSDTGNIINNLYMYPSTISLFIDGATGGTYVGTINGFPYQPFATMALINGGNNNVAIANNTENMRVSGPTGGYSITGFTAGRDGQKLTVLNETSQNMTLVFNSGLSSVGNRIDTLDGSSPVSAGSSIAEFVYSATDGFWILRGTQG